MKRLLIGTLALSWLIPIPASAAKATPLPGVMAVDLYMNLEKQGWKCTRPKQAKDIFDPSKLDKSKTTFDCFSKDKNAYMVAWGTNASNLTWITTDVLNKENYGWLGFIATLPISGVDPLAAQKWVLSAANSSRLKKPVTKLFGDIKFTLTSSSGTARILEISHKTTKKI